MKDHRDPKLGEDETESAESLLTFFEAVGHSSARDVRARLVASERAKRRHAKKQRGQRKRKKR
jgi:hypothetical protein